MLDLAVRRGYLVVAAGKRKLTIELGCIASGSQMFPMSNLPRSWCFSGSDTSSKAWYNQGRSGKTKPSIPESKCKCLILGAVGSLIGGGGGQIKPKSSVNAQFCSLWG